MINWRRFLLKLINSLSYTVSMIENNNLLYLIAGFIFTYLSLEVAWHYTACRIKDNKIRPCVFKEIKTMLVSAPKVTNMNDRP
jgi:hypothetical protein